MPGIRFGTLTRQEPPTGDSATAAVGALRQPVRRQAPAPATKAASGDSPMRTRLLIIGTLGTLLLLLVSQAVGPDESGLRVNDKALLARYDEYYKSCTAPPASAGTDATAAASASAPRRTCTRDGTLPSPAVVGPRLDRIAILVANSETRLAREEAVRLLTDFSLHGENPLVPVLLKVGI